MYHLNAPRIRRQLGQENMQAITVPTPKLPSLLQAAEDDARYYCYAQMSRSHSQVANLPTQAADGGVYTTCYCRGTLQMTRSQFDDLHPRQLKMVHHQLLLRHTADDKITVWWPPSQADEDGTPPVIAEAHWCHDHILPIPTLGSWRWYTTCYCWGKLQMSRSHTANPHPRQLRQGGNNWLLNCPPCSGLLITGVVGVGDDNKEHNDRWWLWWWWWWWW